MILNKLLALFSEGYTYGMLLLIIGYYILKNHRLNIKTFISIGNSWFAIYGVITFCKYFRGILMAWYSQNPYESYIFQSSSFSFNSSFVWIFLIQLVLLFIITIIFLFNRFRRKIWLSILAILSFYFSYITVFYTSLYKYHLRSLFSFYQTDKSFDSFLSLLFFVVLIISSYFIKIKRKKIG